MQPRTYDPVHGSDYVEFWRARVDEAFRQFKDNEITEDVFRASLFALGYRGQELSAEVNLALMERSENDGERHK